MPFTSRRPNVVLSPTMKQEFVTLSGSRTEAAQRVDRARILLAYDAGQAVSAIARTFHTSRPRVERCLNKAVQFRVRAGLEDLPGRGRKASVTPEARAWLTNLACEKPKDVGYARELWTTRLLMTYVRTHCAAAGHPSLGQVGRGSISKMLRASGVHPHKIRYYLERRDPEFDTKMTQVLCVYKPRLARGCLNSYVTVFRNRSTRTRNCETLRGTSWRPDSRHQRFDRDRLRDRAPRRAAFACFGRFFPPAAARSTTVRKS